MSEQQQDSSPQQRYQQHQQQQPPSAPSPPPRMESPPRHGGQNMPQPQPQRFMMPPLLTPRVGDTREHQEGGAGTPTGFLSRNPKPTATSSSSSDNAPRKPTDEQTTRGPPPIGVRPRGSSGNTALTSKVERPGSAEGDDPIPPEYRPRATDKKDQPTIPPRRAEKERERERDRESSSSSSGVGLGLEGHSPQQQMQSTVNPAQQMQQLRKPPVVAGASLSQSMSNRSSDKFVKSPPQPGSQQRSPAEVGLGGYLYSKPIPPPSVGNSGTSNPRFPGGHIMSPLANATSPPGSIGTRESVMRGQWVDDTAAVSGPAPVRKPELPQHTIPPQVYGYENGQFSQPFNKAMSGHTASPPEANIPDDQDESATNPSESPTPDIPHIPLTTQNHDHQKRIRSEEQLFETFSDLFPSLPPTHINALLNFALQLTEDAVIADKAENVRLTKYDAPGTKEQLNILGEKRMRSFRDWANLEEVARSRQVQLMKAPPPEPKPQVNFKKPPPSGYDGMQPLPPPPSLGALDEFGGQHMNHKHQHHHHHQQQSHRQHYAEMPEIPHDPHYRDHDTPSPTPTVDQIKAAPKVELELQMPRPMPSVPAIRIDPSTRRKFEDDASTVASMSRAENRMEGLPGGTPYPFPLPKQQQNHFEENRPVDTKELQDVIQSFTKAKNKDDGEIMADIPPFLHMAYAALDKVTNVAPVDQYLDNARKLLDQKTKNMTSVYQANSMKRAQLNAQQTNAAYSSGRFTFADIERMREQFTQDEAKNQMELEAEIYSMFENEYVEVAYKEVKSQLEDLGGRWYEEVKNWLFTVAGADTRGTGTALEYHLLLEAIDLLNKLHVTMEEHEHILQSLVTERNARYLKISIDPLLDNGQTVRAAEAERRYWIDEQERQIRSKIERGKRVAEHRACVDRVGEQVIEGLRKRYGEVLEAVWGVVWQFPPSVQPTLLRKFFDESTIPINEASSPTSYTVAKENVEVLAEAVTTLGEIVALTKLAMDFRSSPAIRVVEAQLAIQVAEEHQHANGLTAPAATATACAAAVKARLPQALRKVAEECREMTDNVAGGLVEVLERLRIGVEEVALTGGRVEVGGMGMAGMRMWEDTRSVVGDWEMGSGESWVVGTGYGNANAYQGYGSMTNMGMQQQGYGGSNRAQRGAIHQSSYESPRTWGGSGKDSVGSGGGSLGGY
ncbi:hypothetical protein FPQ18DRAFT_351656 [Pyronema domesticum]|nr:hypothetical protein FPQ18DRAFT_351656 [Pyronema domesticum]